MSQVVRAIVGVDSGDRKILRKGFSPLFTDVFDVKATISDDRRDAYGTAKIYKVGVQIGNVAVIEDQLDIDKNSEALHEAIMRTKKAVIEGIFGEFRPYFRQLEIAIYNYDYERAGKLLNQLENKMFEEIE